MSAAIGLRLDFGATELRTLAGRTKNASQARRRLAHAAVYDGKPARGRGPRWRHGPLNSRPRPTSPRCRCCQPLPNAMLMETSGSICARPISQTVHLPTMPSSSMRARTPRASSSKKPAASQPSQPGNGPSSVNLNEGWYKESKAKSINSVYLRV